MDQVGGFALLACRCGKPKTDCQKHPESAASNRVVLPPTVEPTHYDLSLRLFLEQHRFDGEVAIALDVKVATKTVTCHAKELSFTAATCGARTATTIAVDLAATTVTVAFDEALPVGAHTLTLTYGGVLNNDMAGLYRSTYTDARGEKKLMASSQFESIDARRCFPCVDEPGRKATFKV